MPWESKTVEETRKEFIQAAKATVNFSSLCREFGITRKTGYKWVARHENGAELSDRSRRPTSSPKKTSEEIEQQILKLRYENPGWGAKTLHKVLENAGCENLPCVKTVNNILDRNNCILKEESEKRHKYIRYQKEHCNVMWQTDFKGEFLMKDNNYCFPLTIIDDCSRFSIKIAPHTNTVNVVIPAFKEAFYEFGMPNSVLSDNGAQFAGFRHGFTRFEKMLMDYDILPVHCRIKHPQTQGKIERFHRSMKSELLKQTEFNNIIEANEGLQAWRDKYNNLRPHEALNMACPADIYVPSNRTFYDKVTPYDYGGEYHIIKVNSWGYVRFDKWQIYLSETMIDEHIEFRPNPQGDSFIACYRNFKIAEFSADNGKLLNRLIYRL